MSDYIAGAALGVLLGAAIANIVFYFVMRAKDKRRMTKQEWKGPFQ